MFEFCEINQIKRIETEMNEDGLFTLIIKPMNSRKATLFTAHLTAKLHNWNEIKDLGYVRSETAGFEVKENTWCEADTSFIAFTKVSKEEQDSWEGLNKKAPTLLGEVSGNHKNALIDIKKTQKYWMPAGTDYALIFDLEIKKYYFFNRSTSYSTHSFSEKFIAPSDILSDFLT
ncbi:MAG: hypothetical protein EAZ97_01395 [Bacteroidetes bacterium]|nr:MAG: hypothetical protein EAZ97_01395 [Bacteroidota bacterium]